MTAKERALLAEKKNHEAILGENPFDERALRPPFTKNRLKHKELGHDIRFQGYRTENERISSVVEFNNKRDHGEKDTKMIHDPNWRNPDNQKFRGEMKKDGSKTGFDHNFNNFSQGNNPSWKDTPLRRPDDEVQ